MQFPWEIVTKSAPHDVGGEARDAAGRWTSGGESTAHLPAESPAHVAAHAPAFDRVMGKGESVERNVTKLLRAAGAQGLRMRDLVRHLNRGGSVYGEITPGEIRFVLDTLEVHYRGDRVALSEHVAKALRFPWLVTKAGFGRWDPQLHPRDHGRFAPGAKPTDIRHNSLLDEFFSGASPAAPQSKPADIRSGGPDIFGDMGPEMRAPPSRGARGRKVAPGVESARHPSALNPAVTYGHADDRDSDDKHFAGLMQQANANVAAAKRKLVAAVKRGPKATPEVRRLQQQLRAHTAKVERLKARAAAKAKPAGGDSPAGPAGDGPAFSPNLADRTRTREGAGSVVEPRPAPIPLESGDKQGAKLAQAASQHAKRHLQFAAALRKMGDHAGASRFIAAAHGYHEAAGLHAEGKHDEAEAAKQRANDAAKGGGTGQPSSPTAPPQLPARAGGPISPLGGQSPTAGGKTPQARANANGKPSGPPPLPSRPSPPPLPHHRTASEAQRHGNNLARAIRSGNQGAIAQHRQAFESALKAHEAAGHAAIDRMAAEKHGSGMKAAMHARRAKQAFGAKLDAARQRLGSLAMTGKSLGGSPTPLDLDPFRPPVFPWLVVKGAGHDVSGEARDEKGEWTAGGVKALHRDLAARMPDLSDDHTEALGDYISGRYIEINASLREGREATKAAKSIPKIDEAIASAPVLDKPLSVYRGLRVSGEKSKAVVDAARRALASGSPLADKAFLSATIDHDVAHKWATGGPEGDRADAPVVFEISARHGLYLGESVGGTKEKEFLMARGTPLKVTGIESRGGVTYIRAEQVVEANKSLTPSFPWLVTKSPGHDVSGEPRDERGRWSHVHAKIASHYGWEDADYHEALGLGRAAHAKLAKPLGVSVDDLRGAIKERVGAGGAGAKPKAPSPSPPSLPEFAAAVKAAAHESTSGRFGERSVFIGHVWRRLKDQFPGMDLAAFKKRLLEANRERLLDLLPADLLQAADPKDVEESEVAHLGARYHLIRAEAKAKSLTFPWAVVTKGRDASGHEHAADGRFGTGGHSGANGKPSPPGRHATPDGKRPPAPAKAEAKAERKAKSLARRASEVPSQLRHQVTSFVRGRFRRLSKRYGPKGAYAILGAAVLLLPVPVPGSSLIPIAVAEAVLAVRRAVAKSHEAMLDNATVKREAVALLRALYAECGEKWESQ